MSVMVPFARSGAVVAIASALVAAFVAVQRHVETSSSGLSSPRPDSRSPVVTYYVSPTGNNTASGTTPRTAWRTLARASKAVLLPGDRLLLQGGKRFSGQLTIGQADGGSATRPVLISTYGAGRATIVSPSNGILVYDAIGVEISGFVIVGLKAMRPVDAGIQLYSDLAGHQSGHIAISRVNVSRFGAGISIGALKDRAGFRDVSITRAILHGNLDAGLATYGPAFNPAAPEYANEGIHIAHVQAFGNLGDPRDTTHNSGNGIVLGSVKNATVTWSSAHGNGGRGGALHEGPEGLWAYDSTGVVIAHDVAYGNNSRSAADGGGFGLDLNTSDSVLEYDLSYRNHGSGFLIFSTPANPQSGNVIRFDISHGDARGSGPVGGIAVGGTAGSAVYQNTVVMGQLSNGPALRIAGQPRGVKVLNNIFSASSGGLVARAVHSYARSGVLLAGNDYAAPSGHWNVIWAQAAYFSLGTWRAATGEELVRGRQTGRMLLPRFVGPTFGLARGGAGFALVARSPLRHAGLDLVRLFGLRPGRVDFGGKRYSITSPSVGAW